MSEAHRLIAKLAVLSVDFRRTSQGVPSSAVASLPTDNVVDQDDLEDAPEVAAEDVADRLMQVWSGLAGVGLDRRDVVLRDPEPVCQLALGESGGNSALLEVRGPDLDANTHNSEYIRTCRMVGAEEPGLTPHPSMRRRQGRPVASRSSTASSRARYTSTR